MRTFVSSALLVTDNKRKGKLANATDLICKHRIKKTSSINFKGSLDRLRHENLDPAGVK